LYSGNLDNLTLSLNATHPVSGLTEYDVHSLYGHMMSEHTFTYLTGSKTYEFKDTRPFVLTRSSFAGTGRFAAHWLGDNYRNWEAMKYSISGIMNF
jgi:alpha-glucosidase (family GH31 glycosyl hydrolase)